MADESNEQAEPIEPTAVEIIEPTTARRNKGGRPPDENLKAAREARRLLDRQAAESANEVFQLLMDGARNGDSQCLRILCTRLWPERRGATITFSLPPMKTTEDIVAAHTIFLEQVATGVLTPEEGDIITGLIERKAKAMETAELAKEVEALKAQVAQITGPADQMV